MDAEISSHAVSDPRQRIAAVLCVALEVLWLIAVVAVPLAAAPPDAMIGHFEVPKVAVLRVLSFAIVVVWLVEWMVRPPHVWPRLPRVSATGLRSWLKRDPSNWITLTLGIYLVANIVSAATSVSPAVSVWGKRPGWDGYDLYAMLCYTALYLVIVTHLRSPSQAWRLIGALVVTGTTVGIYIILQYLGLDPYLAKGSALTRPYGTLGNPVFAGAVLVMTTTVTVAAGFALIERFRSYWWPVALVAALTPQLLAIILTLTRGAWVGLVAVLASFGLSIIALVALDGKGGGKEGDGPLDSVVVGRVLSIYPEITGSGISQRTDTWIGSIELMLERPWHDVTPIGLPWARHPLGYGPEMFRFTFPLRSEPRVIAQFPYEAHNFALHVGVELGIVGLLSLLAAVFAVLWIGSRRLVVAAHSMPQAHWTILGVCPRIRSWRRKPPRNNLLTVIWTLSWSN